MGESETVSSDDPRASAQAGVLPAMGAAAALATLSTVVWLELTRRAGHLHMDVSMLSPAVWLGFFFVLWPASAFLLRFLWKRGVGNPGMAFFPVGCLLLAPGGILNYAQYRQRSLTTTGQSLEQQRHAEDSTLVAYERDHEKTRAEIMASGRLSAYRSLIHSDGTLPMGVQQALVEVAVSGTASQRHELTASYLSDYVVMRVIACHKQASPEDLRLIFEYYNNPYSYSPRAAKGQQHWWVLSCVAQNSQTPHGILITMLASPGTDEVLNNPGLPRPVVTSFLEREGEGGFGSRMRAARNPATPSGVVLKLLGDQEPQVAAAARHRALALIAAGDPTVTHSLAASRSFDYELMIAVACQKSTTAGDLRLLFRHFADHPTYEWVHDALVKCLDNHPDAPKEALLSMLH